MKKQTYYFTLRLSLTQTRPHFIYLKVFFSEHHTLNEIQLYGFVCKSHTPPWSQMGQSSGWLTSRNSMTPSLAFLATGESVLIFMPFITGMAHEACGCICERWKKKTFIIKTIHWQKKQSSGFLVYHWKHIYVDLTIYQWFWISVLWVQNKFLFNYYFNMDKLNKGPYQIMQYCLKKSKFNR